MKDDDLKIEKVKKAWEDILATIYTNAWRDDPNLIRTPERIARSMVTERCRNISIDIDEVAEKLFDTSFPTNYNGMTVIGPTNVSSQCPHHFENVNYSVLVSYIKSKTIPNRVPGLSKIPRLIDTIGTRPILQEDFIEILADTIQKYVNVDGLGVIVYGKHNCMTCRGIKMNSGGVLTSVLRGTYLTNRDVKNEFYELIKLKMAMESVR